MHLLTLENHFGRYGRRLYDLARGIDHNPVVPNWSSKSISAEDTFERDIPLAETEPLVHKLAEKVWAASHQNSINIQKELISGFVPRTHRMPVRSDRAGVRRALGCWRRRSRSS